MKNRVIEIGNHKIGRGHPVFIIAEAGLNHGGDLILAKAMVREAARAGATAIKFQVFDTDERFGDDEKTKELVRNTELSEEDFRELSDECKKNNIIFFATPFHPDAVDVLERIGVPAYKIASCDISNFQLMEAVLKTQKTVILSRGTAGESEIDAAVLFLRRGLRDIVLLHCISSYPMEDQDANLGAICSIQYRFDLNVGYSDHSRGIFIPVQAVYAGACVIEKHFTLDRKARGIDWEVSAEPQELKQMIDEIRKAEKIVGNGVIEPAGSEDEEIAYRKKIRTKFALNE